MYITAVQHKTFDKNKNYEKLEFLGDAILNSVVSEQLFENKKYKNEGELSKKRAEIVSRKNLNSIGKKIIKETSIKHNLGFLSENIYGNILEALIAAIYLDKGYKQSKIFIDKNIVSMTSLNKKTTNYKSKILEWCQKNGDTIEFKKLKQKGPDHKKQHFIQILINNKTIAEGWGNNIKSAEQKISEIAYKSVY